MGAFLFQSLCHSHVVIQIILGPAVIQNISGIADACLGDLALVESLVESHFHSLYPVERVEYPEYIDT